MAIGGLDFFFFAVQGVGLLALRYRYGFDLAISNGSASHTAMGGIPALLLGVAASDGVLALVGVWWLVYFNTESVRLAFSGDSRADLIL